ncbi:MAG: replication factor C small subunit [Candidatus Thorarchaeota archaeon]|nr:replication factor C small subunit [Candidatus Thorarchaeota archaeon]
MDIDLWTEKHRPRTLTDIVGQNIIVERLVKFVEKKTLPHCLFAGPPGTAKTTAGVALARDLFGEFFERNFMELNASDERGIDVVRNQIKSFARSLPAGGAPFKILVLDEADHLTNDAQHALRRTMESYASSCRMILICNYSSRIIPPIQSRCAVFKFARLSEEDIAERLEYVAKEEGVKLNPKGRDSILYLANGDMRVAINLLQAASSSTKVVTDTAVFAISGRADPQKIRTLLSTAVASDFDQALGMLRILISQDGVAPLDLTRQIHREIHSLEVNTYRKQTILERTAEVEFRVAEGADGEVQLSALLAHIALGQDS